MEESSCRADLVGGAGEQGIMQITTDKCPNRTANAAWYVFVISFRLMDLTLVTPYFAAVTQLVLLYEFGCTRILTKVDVAGNEHKHRG